MPETKHASLPGKLLYNLRELLFIVGAVLIIQVSLVQAYHVPTGSMERTVLTGDRVLVDKITLGPRTWDWVGVPYTDIGFPIPPVKLPGLRDPQPGDIVVVRVPEDDRVPYFKRIVATGGQTVEVRDKRVYVYGVRQTEIWGVQHLDRRTFPERFQQPDMAPGLGNRDNWGPFTVPEDQVFLMGDNRDMSLDSRYFGPVPEENIIGTARMVYFSWNGETKLPRIDRIGKPVW
ncbi:signal peptidase I [bacterium]|nr:signal peptidase I [bacterium]